MGIVNSTAQVAPISLVGSILGFIGFGITVATFLRVFWDNIGTIFKAGRESKNILTTLRTELEEERSSLRGIRRYQRLHGLGRPPGVCSGPELDDADLRNLQVTVRRLTRRFEEIERPFLVNEQELEARKARQQRRASRGRGSSLERRDLSFDVEKGRRCQIDGYESEEERVEHLYDTISLRRRVTWINCRAEAKEMLNVVSRVQTRRIARQVGEVACMLRSYKDTLDSSTPVLHVVDEPTFKIGEAKAHLKIRTDEVRCNGKGEGPAAPRDS